MADYIRVLRVIEYTGPRDKVEDQVARSLHGEKKLGNGIVIRAATVGNYPEIIQEVPSTTSWTPLTEKQAYDWFLDILRSAGYEGTPNIGSFHKFTEDLCMRGTQVLRVGVQKSENPTAD